MAFPRITANVYTLLLIGCLALLAIGGVAFVGPLLAHGNNVGHDAGMIVEIDPNMDFVLKMANGQKVHFQCSERCLKSLPHMERHELIHANTDVYFVRGMANNILMAVDVD